MKDIEEINLDNSAKECCLDVDIMELLLELGAITCLDV